MFRFYADGDAVCRGGKVLPAFLQCHVGQQKRRSLARLLLKSPEGRAVAKTYRAFRAYRAPAAGARPSQIRGVNSSAGSWIGRRLIPDRAATGDLRILDA
jgi:hypothetical protein